MTAACPSLALARRPTSSPACSCCYCHARSQRTVSYHVHSRAGVLVFSLIRTAAADLTAHKPDHFVCVPLILDTLHSRVRGPRQCFHVA